MGHPTIRLVVPIHPSQGVVPELFEWIVSVLRMRNWNVDYELVKGIPSMSARNRACRRALEAKVDYLFTIDSDQIPYVEADKRDSGLDWLLEDITRDEVDTVSVLTVRRTDHGPVPVCQRLTGPAESELYSEILQKPLGCHELVGGAMGGAGILMKRRVLQKFWDEEALWFEDIHQMRRGIAFDKDTGEDLWGTRVVGHDIRFYQRCHEFGFRSWVDTRVLWGHVKDADIREEFLRHVSLMNRNDKLVNVVKALREENDRIKTELSILKNGKVSA